MKFVNKIARGLIKFPLIKKMLKEAYVLIGNFLSDKKTDLDKIIQISSNECAHNFGYYDKCPWSKNQKYMVYLAQESATKNYVSDNPTAIILYDIEERKEKVIAYTNVWNTQQGCMLQWLGPDFSSKILYNDFRDGKYCSVIYTIADSSERVLKLPVYSVSADGKTAITLDFSRLNTFRPGYGYCNINDSTKNEMYPDIPCLWKLDILNDKAEELPISYKSLKEFKSLSKMDKGYHKINHIMINPSGTRFMFIHRWVSEGVTYHRLLTCNMDGTDMYVLIDDGMVSHNNWKDDNTIISYCYSHENGDAYHILHDKTKKREVVAKGILKVDGHPSYSPDKRFIITDTYPDFKRKQSLYLIRVVDGKVKKIGSIYSNIMYKNEVRCDLHPRWNYNSKQICIDGAMNKNRQVYVVDINTEFEDEI